MDFFISSFYLLLKLESKFLLDLYIFISNHMDSCKDAHFMLENTFIQMFEYSVFKWKVGDANHATCTDRFFTPSKWRAYVCF